MIDHAIKHELIKPPTFSDVFVDLTTPAKANYGLEWPLHLGSMPEHDDFNPMQLVCR